MNVSDDGLLKKEVDTAPSESSSDGGVDMESDTTIVASSPGAPAALGAVIVAIGALLLWQAWQVPGTMTPQGPRFLPVVIAVAWTLLGVAYLGGALAALAGRRHQPAGERFDHLLRVGVLLVVLVVYAYAIDPIGYLVSTAVLFGACAALLGSRSFIRDGVIALVLTVAIYFLFSYGLNIYLPPGLLPL
ncbi:tripartite tricarboxylate transporter TctB family protein [Mycobacterium sp. 236(2023)]|uniref:tripartite tricarboxylate transporter TctB family protein n=1 Tax=Mycobacterium sp. 236(2023) TaxID=3038163 RepID=UPI0024159293|nr:tripartite tricarboxylate transporter TctB family protein [Mycobacterium sp. 236(2023)]MDG4668153.1 tripartite tricarboxylate transporter TctB family protein [Mycobacterium sp. 236(2023)]